MTKKVICNICGKQLKSWNEKHYLTDCVDYKVELRKKPIINRESTIADVLFLISEIDDVDKIKGLIISLADTLRTKKQIQPNKKVI